MLACWRLTPAFCLSTGHRSGFYCRAAFVQSHVNGDQIQNNNGMEEEKEEKKIVIALVLLTTLQTGFWYPYRNIFSLVDELGIEPFTNWMKSAILGGGIGGIELNMSI